MCLPWECRAVHLTPPPRTHLSSGLRCPVGRDACGRGLGFSRSLGPRAWLPHAPRSLARCCLPTQVCAFLPLGFLVGMRTTPPQPLFSLAYFLEGRRPEGVRSGYNPRFKESSDTLGSDLGLAMNLFGVCEVFSHPHVPAFTEVFVSVKRQLYARSHAWEKEGSAFPD